MPKLFTKKQIFPFLASFFITLVIGFFIWNIFISIDNGVLNQIGFKIFTASVLPSQILQNKISEGESDYIIENIIPETDLEQEDSNNQDLESDENLSVIQNSVIAPPQSFQDQLDDIQEKLDIISQQLQELVAQQNDKLADEDKILDEEPDDENDQDDEQNENIATYLKILISEVQVAGTSDDKQEFVELYNPNNQDIDLTDWYLQRKTVGSSSWSTYVSNDLFSGKIIPANGYFLIARAGYYLGLADIFTDNPITNDNSFALKNPNGDISDKLGFGNAIDPELIATINPSTSQSIGRKSTEQDTDNNSSDFEIDSPTPKAQNITYTAPISGDGGGGDIVYPKVLISEVQISPIDQRFVELYNPNTTAVNLTGWYLQRKTKSATPSDSWNSFVSSTKFAGKIIPANGYFIISKQLADSDILLDLTITSDNSLALKNPNRDISDKVGFGNTQDFENAPAQNPDAGQSIGRKTLETDTDNNSVDFELQTPTPKAENIKWVEPPVPILESIEITTTPTKLFYVVGDTLDISGLIVIGNYSDGTRQIETITPEDITGFDSSSPITGQILTITVGEFTTTYTIDINSIPILQSISITTPATKLSYIIGDLLDITGLVVTGTYSDGNTKIETIMLEDITGFDSTTASSSEVLTITIAGISTTYEISVVEASVTQLKIISPIQTILIGSPSGVFTVESQNAAGVLTKVLTTTYVNLFSDSPTGLFSSAPSGGPCGSDWTKTSITISKNTAHKSFCYKDSTQGTPTITVSATGLFSDFQIIIVNAIAP